MNYECSSICILCGEVKHGGGWMNKHSNVFQVLKNAGKVYFCCDGVTTHYNDICGRCFNGIRHKNAPDVASYIQGKKVYDKFFDVKRTKEERRNHYEKVELMLACNVQRKILTNRICIPMWRFIKCITGGRNEYNPNAIIRERLSDTYSSLYHKKYQYRLNVLKHCNNFWLNENLTNYVPMHVGNIEYFYEKIRDNPRFPGIKGTLKKIYQRRLMKMLKVAYVVLEYSRKMPRLNDDVKMLISGYIGFI